MTQIRFLFGIISVLWLFLVSCGSENGNSYEIYEDAKVEMVVRHPRVIWTEDPSGHAIISWTTSKYGDKHFVEYEAGAGNIPPDNLSQRVPTSRDGRITLTQEDIAVEVPSGFYHHAELTNLSPSTTYYFRVCSGGICSEVYHFITAPAHGTGFSLLSGGDSRIGGPHLTYGGKTPHVDRQLMNKMVSRLVEKEPQILAFVHGADYCATADWRHLYWWFEDQMKTITKDNRILPLIISRGNHDMEIGFTENFWLGDISNKNSEAYYYTTKFSDDVALITLNTETSITGGQRKWLEGELEKLRPAHNWLFVQYHKPAWPAVKEFTGEKPIRIRNHWIPLFEKYNIDLAIESDGHAMKRTVPIRNGEIAQDGIVYIGEGGMGVPQRYPTPSRWYLMSGGYTKSAHHLWKLDISDDRTELTALGINRDTLDRYTLYRRN